MTEIELNLNNIPESTVKNSKLNSERDEFEKYIKEKFMFPIRALEKQIQDEKRKEIKDEEKLKALNLRLNSIADSSKAALLKYENEYIEKNTHSLFSLYLLTRLEGLQVDEKSRKLFNSLSDDLKRHNRAAVFTK